MISISPFCKKQVEGSPINKRESSILRSTYKLYSSLALPIPFVGSYIGGKVYDLFYSPEEWYHRFFCPTCRCSWIATENHPSQTTVVLCDQIGRLVTPKSLKLYPDKIRRIKYYDAELDREFVFITNNMELDAKDIAVPYKNRWSVELFFKWIKQHLRVKSFWGTTMNAVKIRYIALSLHTVWWPLLVTL